jgi:dihydrofolate reductase
VPASVLFMSMSLDGFVTGPNEGPDNPLGDGGDRLHEWVLPGGADDHRTAASRLTGVNRQVVEEFMSTGAVVTGRQTFEPAHGWDGDHHDGVPVYVVSRGPAPEWAAGWPGVHYVDDLAYAMSEAKRAAGERDVMVHGARLARMLVTGGLLDEVQVHLVPVLLGGGRLLFDGLTPPLERVRVLEGEDGITHLRYRVASPRSTNAT